MSVRLNWRGKQIQARLDAACKQAIDLTTAGCTLASQRLLDRTSGGGRQYWKGGKLTRVAYNASAPGEAPVRVQGLLQGSIKSKQAQKIGKRIVGEWGSYNVAYARALELGYAPRNLAKRPYLRPTAEVEYPKLKGRIAKLFAKGAA